MQRLRQDDDPVVVQARHVGVADRLRMFVEITEIAATLEQHDLAGGDTLDAEVEVGRATRDRECLLVEEALRAEHDQQIADIGVHRHVNVLHCLAAHQIGDDLVPGGQGGHQGAM